MATTEECFIFQERSNTLGNFHKLLKSRSSKESFKHHIHEIAPVSKSQFKTFKEEEDDEFAATLKKAESLDYNNCIWLSSSGPSSPSSCFQDTSFCYYTDVKIDAWFISLLSTPSTKPREILSTKVTFFDGSRVNPIEEASLVLAQTKLIEENLIFQESLEEKEVVSWLTTSIENESSSISSITDSSDDHSFSSCSSSDYSSEVVDLDEDATDKPLFWPSEWASGWDSDTKDDIFIMSPRKDTYKFDSDKVCNRRLLFSTHPNRINDANRIRNKPSRFKNPTKTSSKIVPLDIEADFGGKTEDEVFNGSEAADTGADKTPVFWPSECASEWCSDANMDLFVMSPCKDVCKSFRDLNGKMDLEKGCSRRLEFNRCIEGEEEVKPLTMKSVSKQKHRIVLEDLLLVDKLNVDGAIEEALGLDEFDGHEGLGSEEFAVLEIF